MESISKSSDSSLASFALAVPVPIKNFVKGSITGFTEAAICYPTEYIKTQLQLQSKTNPEFKGMTDCAVKTVQKDGPLALYRGALPLILGTTAKQSTRWAGYFVVFDKLKDEQGNVTMLQRSFAGACGGITEAVLVVTPVETLKSRVIDDTRRGTGKYRGSVDGFAKIIRSEGPIGLYRGAVPTILKQGTNQAVRFPCQHFLLRMMVGDDKEKQKSPLINGVAGAGAGAISVVLTMPQDVIKTRMQGEDAKRLYSSTLDCARQIIAKDGFLFFYSGMWPRMVRVSLDVAITFCIFPLLSQYI